MSKKPGFRPVRKTYTLQFTSAELDGLEVRMASLSIGEFTQLTGALTDGQQASGIGDLLETFASKIISWNLEGEDGEPVPATSEGVQSQDLDLIMAVIRAWMDAIAGVDPTLLAGANGGGTSPERSIPMEVSSPSHLS